LIAILFLTGIRVSAAVSLRLKHIDLENRCVDQDASEVNTKFGKNMLTGFFPVDAYFATVVIEWIQERTVNGAGPDAPLFPAMPLRFGRPNTVLPLERCWTTPKPAQTVLRKACQAAGITEFGPHSIRSTLTLLGAQLGLNREAEKASLPSLIVTFLVAWLASLVLPRPRANWKHCLTALVLTWIVVVMLAPWFGLSYMARGPQWRLFGFQLEAHSCS
jgi:integrase